MNKVVLVGRLTRDPDVRTSTGENGTAFASYTLAVDRRFSRRDEADNGQTADFIRCVVFGRGAEFAQKYLHQGTKIMVVGRIQTGSYTNRDGQKVYTTDVIVEEQEFAESKAAASAGRGNGMGQNGQGGAYNGKPEVDESGFLNIPEGIEDGLPFD